MRLARADWRETTARRYAESLDLHVLPSLGNMFLDALTPRAIELAIAEWARDYARSTVNSWLRVLRTTLNDAVAQCVIATNPAARVRALRERSDDEGDEDDWGPTRLHQSSSTPTYAPGKRCTPCTFR